MLKNLIIHPFFFSLFPVLFIFQHNIHEVPLHDIFLPLSITVILIFVVWIILRFFLKNGKKSGLILSLIIIMFILYANLHILILNSESEFAFLGKNIILGGIFSGLVIIGIIYFVKTRRVLDNANSITNVISLSLIGFLVIGISGYYFENSADDSALYFLKDLPSSTNTESIKPDIYFFIFDEYAGRITLENDFGFDNSKFLKELQDRGFYVPDISYSNYPNSDHSDTSVLNMGYLGFLTEILGTDSKDMRIPTEIKNNSLVMNVLKLHDYKIVSFYGGYGAIGNTKLVDEKLCSYMGINNDLRTNLILTYLPITKFNTDLIHGHQREKIECVFSTAPNIQGTDESPVFVLSHLLLPHHPYIYDSEGNSVEAREWGDKEAYLDQLQYTNLRILGLVDKILENSNKESVIIITSDHGFRPGIDWENPSNEHYRAAFNNLGAYYLPNKMDDLPERISGVNIFRIIFNSYLDTDYEMLNDEQYWYNSEKPFDYKNISEKLFK